MKIINNYQTLQKCTECGNYFDINNKTCSDKCDFCLYGGCCCVKHRKIKAKIISTGE